MTGAACAVDVDGSETLSDVSDGRASGMLGKQDSNALTIVESSGTGS